MKLFEKEYVIKHRDGTYVADPLTGNVDEQGLRFTAILRDARVFKSLNDLMNLSVGPFQMRDDYVLIEVFAAKPIRPPLQYRNLEQPL